MARGDMQRWSRIANAPTKPRPMQTEIKMEVVLSPEIQEARDRKKKVSRDVQMASAYLNKRNSAEGIGREFSLTMEDWICLFRSAHCAYTGVKMEESGRFGITMERINPELGYTVENTVAVTSEANSHKAQLDGFIKGGVIPDAMKIKLLRKAIYQLEKKEKQK